MARTPTTIAELQKLLAKQKAELASLKKARQDLVLKLRAVDKQIAALEGGKKPVAAKPKKRRVAKKKRARAPMGKRAGKLTLRAAVNQVLAGATSAMTTAEVSEKLPATGFKTASKNLDRMVRELLRTCKDFRRASRGRYQLKKG